MGSWSSRVWGPRAGAVEGAAGPRGDGAFPKRKRGEGLSESESGDESEGEERLLSTPRRYGRGSGKPPGLEGCRPSSGGAPLWPEAAAVSWGGGGPGGEGTGGPPRGRRGAALRRREGGREGGDRPVPLWGLPQVSHSFPGGAAFA